MVFIILRYFPFVSNLMSIFIIKKKIPLDKLNWKLNIPNIILCSKVYNSSKRKEKGKMTTNSLFKKQERRACLGLSGKESVCQCRGCRFDPWPRKVPHAVEQLSWCTPTIEPVLESPGFTASGASAPAACAWEQEKSQQWETRTPQPERRPRSNRDPAQPK